MKYTVKLRDQYLNIEADSFSVDKDWNVLTFTHGKMNRTVAQFVQWEGVWQIENVIRSAASTTK